MQASQEMQGRTSGRTSAAVSRLGEYAVELDDLAERLTQAFCSVTNHEPTPETATKVQPNPEGCSMAMNLNEIGDNLERTIDKLRTMVEDCDL